MEMIIYTSIAILNVITFFLYGIDKWKAKKDRWRIPESTLLLLAVLGGSIGAWLGMKTEESYPFYTHTPPVLVAVLPIWKSMRRIGYVRCVVR